MVAVALDVEDPIILNCQLHAATGRAIPTETLYMFHFSLSRIPYCELSLIPALMIFIQCWWYYRLIKSGEPLAYAG